MSTSEYPTGITYVKKEPSTGLIEDSVTLSSDSVSLRSIIIDNTQATDTVGIGDYSIKLDGVPIYNGESFGSWTSNIPGTPTDPMVVDQTYFTFTEDGTYQVKGIVDFSLSAGWIVQEVKRVEVIYDDQINPPSVIGRYNIDSSISTLDLMVRAKAGHVLLFNYTLGSIAETAQQQPDDTYIEIWKVGKY